MNKLKITSVVGARPNFVKIAPLCRAFEKVKDKIEHRLLHTGQHYDANMSSDFFQALNIPEPDEHLEVGSGSHAVQTANIMVKFEESCLKHNPDWIVVVGDVNSTAACTIVAKKLGIKVAHVEAGLRSYDMSMPEEVNRKVTDCLCDLLLTPSRDGDENLLKEGVEPEKIKFVGNIMVDTLVREMPEVERVKPFTKWDLGIRGYVYVTMHRPGNVDDKESLKTIFNSFEELSSKYPIVLPLHPRTGSKLEEFGLKGWVESMKNLHLTDPVSYHESIGLAKNARFVVTDSGGLQEETTFMGVPCLTLRPNTERPVTITEGTNSLTTVERLKEDINRLLKEEGSITGKPPPEYWDGRTADRIVNIFLSLEN